MLSKLMDKQGVTLVELLVILSITVILAATAVPNFLSFIRNHRISSTMENLYYVLQYARGEAVKRNTTIYVSFQTGSSWCYGVNAGSACTCSTANSCGLGSYSYTGTNLMTLTTSGMTGNSIQFEGTHAAANASATVTFTINGTANLITLTIGRLGSLQMCSTGISGYTAC